MRDRFQKNDLMAFLELGIEYTKASLAYADNYFIVSAIEDLWPSAKRCAFVAFRHGGTQVLGDNLAHMEESIQVIRERDEQALADILHRYAVQQWEQVLSALNHWYRENSGERRSAREADIAIRGPFVLVGIGARELYRPQEGISPGEHTPGSHQPRPGSVVHLLPGIAGLKSYAGEPGQHRPAEFTPGPGRQ